MKKKLLFIGVGILASLFIGVGVFVFAGDAVTVLAPLYCKTIDDQQTCYCLNDELFQEMNNREEQIFDTLNSVYGANAKDNLATLFPRFSADDTLPPVSFLTDNGTKINYAQAPQLPLNLNDTTSLSVNSQEQIMYTLNLNDIGKISSGSSKACQFEKPHFISIERVTRWWKNKNNEQDIRASDPGSSDYEKFTIPKNGTLYRTWKKINNPIIGNNTVDYVGDTHYARPVQVFDVNGNGTDYFLGGYDTWDGNGNVVALKQLRYQGGEIPMYVNNASVTETYTTQSCSGVGGDPVCWTDYLCRQLSPNLITTTWSGYNVASGVQLDGSHILVFLTAGQKMYYQILEKKTVYPPNLKTNGEMCELNGQSYLHYIPSTEITEIPNISARYDFDVRVFSSGGKTYFALVGGSNKSYKDLTDANTCTETTVMVGTEQKFKCFPSEKRTEITGCTWNNTANAWACLRDGSANDFDLIDPTGSTQSTENGKIFLDSPFVEENLFNDLYFFEYSSSSLRNGQKFSLPMKKTEKDRDGKPQVVPVGQKNLRLGFNAAHTQAFLFGGNLENIYYVLDTAKNNAFDISAFNNKWIKIVLGSEDESLVDSGDETLTPDGANAVYKPYLLRAFVHDDKLTFESSLTGIQPSVATQVCRSRRSAWPCNYQPRFIRGRTTLPIYFSHARGMELKVDNNKVFNNVRLRTSVTPLTTLTKDNVISFIGNVKVSDFAKNNSLEELRLHSVYFIEDGDQIPVVTDTGSSLIFNAANGGFKGFTKNFFNTFFKIKPISPVESTASPVPPPAPNGRDFQVSQIAYGNTPYYAQYRQNGGDFESVSVNYGGQVGPGNSVCHFCQFSWFAFLYDLPTKYHALMYSGGTHAGAQTAELKAPDLDKVSNLSFLWNKDFTPGHHRVHMLVTATHSLQMLQYKVRGNLIAGTGGAALRKGAGHLSWPVEPSELGLSGAYSNVRGPFKVYYQAYTIDFNVPEISNFSSDKDHPTVISSIRPEFNVTGGLAFNNVDFFMGDNVIIDVKKSDLPVGNPLRDTLSNTESRSMLLPLSAPLNDLPLNLSTLEQKPVSTDGATNNIQFGGNHTSKAFFIRTNNQGEVTYAPQMVFAPLDNLNNDQKTLLAAQGITSNYYKVFTVVTDEQGNKLGTPPVYIKVVQPTNTAEANFHVYEIFGNAIRASWKPFDSLVFVQNLGQPNQKKYFVRADKNGNVTALFDSLDPVSVHTFDAEGAEIPVATPSIALTAPSIPHITNYVSGDTVYSSQPLFEGTVVADENVFYRVYFRPTKSGVPSGYFEEDKTRVSSIERGVTKADAKGYFAFMPTKYLVGSPTGIYYVEVGMDQSGIDASEWPNSSVLSIRYQKESFANMTGEVLPGAPQNHEDYLNKGLDRYTFGLYSGTDQKADEVRFTTPAKLTLHSGQVIMLPAKSQMQILKNDPNGSYFYIPKGFQVIDNDKKIARTVDFSGVYSKRTNTGIVGLLKDDEVVSAPFGGLMVVASDVTEVIVPADTKILAYKIPDEAFITLFGESVVDAATRQTAIKDRFKVIADFSGNFANTRFVFANLESVYNTECARTEHLNPRGANGVVGTLERCRLMSEMVYPKTRDPQLFFPHNGDILDQSKKLELMGTAWPNSVLQIIIAGQHAGSVTTDTNGHFYWQSPQLFDFQTPGNARFEEMQKGGVSIDIFDLEQDTNRMGILVSFEEHGKKLEGISTGTSDTTDIDQNVVTAGLTPQTLKDRFSVAMNFDSIKKPESLLGRVKHFLVMSF